MELSDLNTWLPILPNIVEVKASTKKKNATVTIIIPDELCNHFMKLAMGNKVEDADYFVLAYLDKTIPKEK